MTRKFLPIICALIPLAGVLSAVMIVP